MRKTLAFFVIIALLFSIMIVPVNADTIPNLLVTCSSGLVTVNGNIGTQAGRAVSIKVYKSTDEDTIVYIDQTTTGANGILNYSFRMSLATSGESYKLSVWADNFSSPDATKTFTYTTASTGGDTPPPPPPPTPTPTPTPITDETKPESVVGGTDVTPDEKPVVKDTVIPSASGEVNKGKDEIKNELTGLTAGSGATSGTTQPPVVISNEKAEVISQKVTELAKVATNAGDINAAADTMKQVAKAAAGAEQDDAALKLIGTVINSAQSLLNNAKAKTEADSIVNNKSINALMETAQLALSSNADAATKQQAVKTVSNSLQTATQNLNNVKTEDSTLQAVNSVIDTVLLAANATSLAADANQKAELQKETAKMVKETSKLLSNIKTEANAIVAAQQVSSLLNRTAIAAAASNDKEAAKELAKSVTGIISSTAQLMDKVTTQDKAVELVASILKKTTEVSSTAQIAGTDMKDAKKEAANLANKTVERFSKQKVEPVVEGTKAKATLGEAQKQAIIEKATKSAQIANALAKDAAALGEKIEKKVIVDVQAASGVNEVVAELSSDIWAGVKAAGVEKIEIATGDVSLGVPPGAIPGAENAASVSIGVNKVTVDNELLEKMTDAQKELLGNGKTLFNFDAVVTDKEGKASTVSSFGENKVTAKLKYDLKSNEDPDNITILYLADDGTVKNMQGKYDSATGLVSFETNHFSKYMIKNLILKFSDIAASFWGKKPVESMASKGVVNGKPDGSYDPNGFVTRAEFAKMVVIAAGIYNENDTCSFKDVSKKDWYYSYVGSAVKAGIVTGYTDGTFKPNEKISRQNMAVMISRALKEQPPKNTEQFLNFADNSKIGGYAKSAVATVVRDEIMNGKSNNMLDPQGNATRAEAAAVIYRYFNYKD